MFDYTVLVNFPRQFAGSRNCYCICPQKHHCCIDQLGSGFDEDVRKWRDKIVDIHLKTKTTTLVGTCTIAYSLHICLHICNYDAVRCSSSDYIVNQMLLLMNAHEIPPAADSELLILADCEGGSDTSSNIRV